MISLVDVHNGLEHKLVIAEMFKTSVRGLFLDRPRLHKISPQQRMFSDNGIVAMRYDFLLFENEILIDVFFGFFCRLIILIHNMKCIKIRQFGINTVGRKSAAKTVRPLPLRRDRIDDCTGR